MMKGLALTIPESRGGAKTIGEQLRAFGGLTFFKDYGKMSAGEHTAAELNADISAGSAAATFTAAYSGKTSTWIDDDGVIHQHSGTDNLARVNGGFFDATGFHRYDSNSKRIKGLMVEAAGTNYLLNTYFSLGTTLGTSWGSSVGTNSLETCAVNGISGGKSQKNSHSFSGEVTRYYSALFQNSANDTFDASGGNISVTLSFLARGDLSGIAATPAGVNSWVALEAVNNAGTWQQNAIKRLISQADGDGLSSTEWRKFVFSGTITDTDTRKVSLKFLYFDAADGSRPTTGESYWLEVYDVQVEKNPYATSFIPTTTASLSRPAETLTYLTSGNRTKASESMFMAFSPFHSGTGTTNYRSGFMALYDTETKRRKNSCWPVANGGKMRHDTNSTDSDPADIANSTTQPAINVKYVVAVTSQHSNPYATISVNGVNEGSNTTIDWIDPEWGSKFWIGSDNNNGNQFGGIFSNVAFYGTAKSATDVSSISSILASP